eukprot:COSAG01_NODE_2105_length_8423_cov_6.483409_5_plen_88_part_00
MYVMAMDEMGHLRRGHVHAHAVQGRRRVRPHLGVAQQHLSIQTQAKLSQSSSSKRWRGGGMHLTTQVNLNPSRGSAHEKINDGAGVV